MSLWLLAGCHKQPATLSGYGVSVRVSMTEVWVNENAKNAMI